MKLLKIKADITVFSGLALGIAFPMTHYADAIIVILCFNINFKWRKR